MKTRRQEHMNKDVNMKKFIYFSFLIFLFFSLSGSADKNTKKWNELTEKYYNEAMQNSHPGGIDSPCSTKKDCYSIIPITKDCAILDKIFNKKTLIDLTKYEGAYYININGHVRKYSSTVRPHKLGDPEKNPQVCEYVVTAIGNNCLKLTKKE